MAAAASRQAVTRRSASAARSIGSCSGACPVPRAKPSSVSRIRVIRRPSSRVASTSPSQLRSSPVASDSRRSSSALSGLRSSCEAFSANSCCRDTTRSISPAMRLNSRIIRRSSGGPVSSEIRASMSPRSIASMARSRVHRLRTHVASRSTTSKPTAIASRHTIASIAHCTRSRRAVRPRSPNDAAPITSPSSTIGRRATARRTAAAEDGLGQAPRRPESASCTFPAVGSSSTREASASGAHGRPARSTTTTRVPYSSR